MSFFGPGGLASAGPNPDDPYEQLLSRLKAQYPHVFAPPQQQAPNTMAGLNYTSMGPQFFPGQGAPAFISPFTSIGAGAVPESLTAALAGGGGRSSTQLPNTGGGATFGAPQLQVPGAPSVDLSGFSRDFSSAPTFDVAGPGSQSTSGGGVGVLDVLGAGGNAVGNTLNFFSPEPSSPPQQVSNPQGTGRDYSWATGSPGGIPQYQAFEPPAVPGAVGGPGVYGGAIANEGGAQGLRSLGTMTPGMDAAFIQPTTPGGAGADMGGLVSLDFANATPSFQTPDLSFNSFLNALGLGAGALTTAGGIQAGDPLQTVGGIGQTLQGAVGLAGPQNMQALASAINGTIPGLAFSGPQLAALANVPGGLLSLYGLYQGIQTGDPTQIASSLYGIYGLAGSVSPLVGGPALPGIGTLAGQGLAAIAPELAASLGIGLTGAAGVGTIGGSLLAAIGPAAAAQLAGAAAPSAAGAILGGTVGAAGTGAGAGAGAGIGAAAGGLGAGATAGIIALPMIAAYLGVSIDDILSADRAASREAGRQQRFQRGLPTIMQDIQQGADLMSKLTPQATDEDLLNMYNTLGTIERNWEGGPATGNPKAPNFPAMIGGMSDAGRTTREQIDPYLAQVALGRLRAEDLMRARGLDIPGGGHFTPELAAKLLGGATSAYDPESGSFLGMPNYLSTNPWMQANYLAPSAAEYQRQLAGWSPTVIEPGGEAGNWQYVDYSGQPDYRTISAWSPEATQAFGGMRPGGYEAGVRSLLGLPEATYGFAAPVPTTRYGALNIPDFAQAGLNDQYIQQQVTAAQTAQQAAFADFQRQLEQYVSQAQGSGLFPAGAPMPAQAQTPALGANFAQSFAGLPAWQQEQFRSAGLDPELLRQLGWAI